VLWYKVISILAGNIELDDRKVIRYDPAAAAQVYPAP